MPTDPTLKKYVKAFRSLRTHKSRAVWGIDTNYRAPHKPLLLLVVIDLFAAGAITNNLIEFTTQMRGLFADYWSWLKPRGREQGSVVDPFFYLRSEGFWRLVPRPGYEDALANTDSIITIGELQEKIAGARLDDDLYHILQIASMRTLLRNTLIENYFSEAMQENLLAQAQLHQARFRPPDKGNQPRLL